MPVVDVRNIPRRVYPRLVELHGAFLETSHHMGIKRGSMHMNFLEQAMPLETCIFANISSAMFHEKPEQGEEFKSWVGSMLHQFATMYIPECRMVEVFLGDLDPKPLARYPNPAIATSTSMNNLRSCFPMGIG